MRMICVCGTMLSNVGQPNDTEHLMMTSKSIETLQDLADEEVAKEGTIDLWPEHWEQNGAVEVWKCHKCDRLYVDPNGPADQVVVYAIEKIGV
jgi:hypothetical protein